ncbi:DNA recombination protein RmuC [Chitinophaga agrisoli]|uniref:DNA recombination protein RmuC n=1 Tax=Chitinophaga agrisoli TaxID=2607653 RepID=A0A5B2VNI9_9BACT|nr:DNA recombination protein RmuC [Chitinophaga agrisoli]KAA2239966.1 DNA recombination protein RmuC [Chitinophaga agrisoli]
MELIYVLLALIVLLLIVVLVFAYKAAGNTAQSQLNYKIETLSNAIQRVEASVKNEIATNRLETNNSTQSTRTELQSSLHLFGEQLSNAMKTTSGFQKSQLETFSNNLSMLTRSMEEKQHLLMLSIEEKLRLLTRAMEEKQHLLTTSLEKKISDLQSGNEKKLDEMRATVDEKLQQTLETRLSESFRLVSERLEAVHKGLGDMQQLATGVGDLKRVLSNVKTRGILGEYQLENMLEQLLTPDQYAKNVKTKAGSNALVEFAVKLPGKEDKQPLWLPIDSKFPKEDFELLLEAYDKALPELIEECRKNFVRGIKKCAVDIFSKYIDPPNTTDFAILFLPFESLYAEVIRTPGLFETIQRESRIIITGPTTLSALLNSLQMGFRTLAIEKRSSEVWELLGAVKTEFGNFGAILEKTQKKLQEASNVIDDASRRSRVIEKKLKNVQELPREQVNMLLGNGTPLEDEQP